MTYKSQVGKTPPMRINYELQGRISSRIVKMYFDLCCKKYVMHFVILLNNVFLGFKVI